MYPRDPQGSTWQKHALAFQMSPVRLLCQGTSVGWHADDEQLFQGKSGAQNGKRAAKSGKLPKNSHHSDHFATILPFSSFAQSQYHPISLFWNSVLATAVLRAQDCRIISLSLGATRSFELRRNWHLGSTKRRCAVLQVSFGVISYILYNILITLYAFLQYNLTSSIFGCGFSFAVWHVLEPSLDPRLHGK